MSEEDRRNDESEITHITYMPGDPETPPAQEAIRQVYSAIALVRDRLDEVEIEHAYSDAQKELFQEAVESFQAAHKLLRRAGQLVVSRGETI